MFKWSFLRSEPRLCERYVSERRKLSLCQRNPKRRLRLSSSIPWPVLWRWDKTFGPVSLRDRTHSYTGSKIFRRFFRSNAKTRGCMKCTLIQFHNNCCMSCFLWCAIFSRAVANSFVLWMENAWYINDICNTLGFITEHKHEIWLIWYRVHSCRQSISCWCVSSSF